MPDDSNTARKQIYPRGGQMMGSFSNSRWDLLQVKSQGVTKSQSSQAAFISLPDTQELCNLEQFHSWVKARLKDLSTAWHKFRKGLPIQAEG